MAIQLHQVKAQFFRMVGHPVRIHILELLQDGPRPVRELVAALGVEPPNASQQLALLRRSGLVVSTRHGSTVVYALAEGEVTDLLRIARRILLSVLADRDAALGQLCRPEADGKVAIGA